MKNDDFALYVSKFFTNYLPNIRNASPNTILSYRDTFTKLLTYFKNVHSITPDKLTFSNCTRTTIEDFLSYLENTGKCSISTRNQRLAALKSFFCYTEVERPDLLLQCQQIINIQMKKTQKPVIEYLTGDETKFLLAEPDISTQRGRRDLALLTLMYDSAARVQEICDLKANDVTLEIPAVVRVLGKGRKARSIPLNTSCATILKKYMAENHLIDSQMSNAPLFFNSRKEKLTRSGVSYILSKYVKYANEHGGNIHGHITPHCLRHSKAMHMVEAGINLIYIRDFLGHESIETTQVYAKANPESRRKAIEKMEIYSPQSELPDWNSNSDLMTFLQNI